MSSNLLKLPIQRALKLQSHKPHFHSLKPSRPSLLFHFPNTTKIPISSPCHQTLLHKSKITPLSPLFPLPNFSHPTKLERSRHLRSQNLSLNLLEKPLNNLRLASSRSTSNPDFVSNSQEKGPKLTSWTWLYGRTLPTPKLHSKPLRLTLSSPVDHLDISSITNGNTRILSSVDVAVFLAPEGTQLDDMKTVADLLYPEPVVIFNPKWVFEDEAEFGELSGFVGSFEVIFSFLGLEVKALLSKRNGVIFKCVRDGVVSCEKWAVLVEEEGQRFRPLNRASIGEVENVLYNLMAINSPLSKSEVFRGFGVKSNWKEVSFV